MTVTNKADNRFYDQYLWCNNYASDNEHEETWRKGTTWEDGVDEGIILKRIFKKGNGGMG
jgi:hypothetical protein